jgi:hypothetical protein
VIWNRVHITNAKKFEPIRRAKKMLGLFTPTIATPLELIGGIDVVEVNG